MPYSIRNTTGALLAAMVCVVGLASPVASARPSSDFSIDNNAEYQDFKGAVKLAEYVRDDFITGAIAIYDGNGNVTGEADNPPGTKPSVIGTIAAAVAFNERNPTAGAAATEEFIEAFEAQLESYRADDPYLNRPSNFIAAMRRARVSVETTSDETSNLRGYDTDVAERALELLGITLPRATSRAEMNDRVAAHERGLVRSLGTSSELVLLLTHALMNQHPDGSTRGVNVTSTYRDYLRDDAGYLSAWNQGTYPKPEINDAIDELPDNYDEYQDALADAVTEYTYDPDSETLEEYRARTEGTEGNEFQARLRAAVYGIFDEIDVLSSEIDPVPLTLAESSALTPEQLAQIAIGRRNDLREVSGERASISANAILLYQDTNAAEYAERQMDLGAATLGANKNWANAKAGTQLGMNVLGIGLAILDDDVTSAYGFFTDSVMTSLDLAENNASSGVTLDDIYVQLREIQQQLVDMQQQLNERFDQVDQKLDIIFDTMVDGFDVLAVGQDQIRAAIDLAIDLIQQDSSTTSSLESTLLAVQAEELDTFFSLAANDRLGARVGGSDFPYNSGGGGDDFDSAASDFGVFATQTADDIVYTGDPAQVDTPAEALAFLEQADETLTDQPVSSRLNQLIPLSSLWLDSSEYAMVPQSVVGPEPWSLASTAYLQLAHESPWYFNRLYSGQLASGSTPVIDQMIADGEALVTLAQAFGQTETVDDETVLPLFEGLVANYKEKTAELQAHIEDSIIRYLERDNSVGPVIFDVPLSNSNQTLDLWLDDTRIDTTDLADRISRYVAWRSNSNDLTGLPNQAQEGYRSVTGVGFRSNGDSEINAALRAQLHSLLQASRNGGDHRRAMWYMVDSSFDNRTEFWVEIEQRANDYAPGSYEQFRRLEVQRQIRLRNIDGSYSSWVNSGYNNNLGNWADFIERMWDRGLSDTIVSGDRYNSNQVAATGPTPPAGGTQERLRVTQDFSNGISRDSIEDSIKTELTTARDALRSVIYTDMLTPGINTYQGKSLADRVEALDDAEAILDAYVSIAFPNALESSQLLRSALRGAPPARDIDGNIIVEGSEVGIRSGDLLELMERFFEADIDPDDEDTLTDFGDPAFDLPAIEDILNARIDLVYDEIVAATQLPVRAAPYAEMVLAELNKLRENYNALAVPDIYESQIEGAVRSVLANDTRQLRYSEKVGPGVFNDVEREIECDMSFGPSDPGYVAPSNGTVEMFEDGTFVYTPNTGFSGADQFTYRIRCNVAEEGQTPNYAYSRPTWVRVRTINCPLDLVDQGDDLGSEINAFDIREYIGERTSAPSISGIIDAAIAGDCQ